jgi:hypothetical protein
VDPAVQDAKSAISDDAFGCVLGTGSARRPVEWRGRGSLTSAGVPVLGGGSGGELLDKQVTWVARRCGYGFSVFDRIRHGWDLTKKSWSVVRSHPRLVKLPVTGGVLAIVVFVVVGLPGVALLSVDDAAATFGGVVLLMVAAYLASFSVIHYNIALAAGRRRQGRRPQPPWRHRQVGGGVGIDLVADVRGP